MSPGGARADAAEALELLGTVTALLGRHREGSEHLREEVDQAKLEGRRVLLFDDLFRYRATMNAITGSLYDQGRASDVYALTLTRTRSNQ